MSLNKGIPYRVFKWQVVCGLSATSICCENGITIALSFDMPVGYETAYGTYDVTVNTLFLNAEFLKNASRSEAMFYIYHELRHAVQYLCPWLFDKQIQESRSYVILYNGICYKLIDHVWHEMDANAFAYDSVRKICADTMELRQLYDFGTPKQPFDYRECRELFSRIDHALLKKGMSNDLK